MEGDLNMAEFITLVYLFYMFVALYFLLLFIMTFLFNRRELFYVPKISKDYTLSVLVPSYNEEKSLEGTVESLLKSDYKNILEIIIINDGSSDNTLKIAKRLKDTYEIVKVLDKPNSGKADSLNKAIKFARGELIAVVDADSYPSENAISSMIGFFDEGDVGAVTTRVQVRNPKKFIQKLQSIEYKVIAFTRKMLGFLDAIYVTPGPLAIYKKSALEKIGGFDTKNMTEDIEATWHLIHDGYKIRMSFAPKVLTVAPDTFKKWFKQRIRWNIGGFQTISKYKGCFFKKGMLGSFILPFFVVSLVLGVVGLAIFIYRFSRRVLVYYLSTKYTLEAEVALLVLEDISIHPSVLHLFGICLFFAGLAFVLFALNKVEDRLKIKRENIFTVLFYSLIYALLYPIILITSGYKLLKGEYSWR